MTRIQDVIWDVQYLCFENLDLHDLFSLAQTNRYFASLAEYIFAQKHSKKRVRAVIVETDGSDHIHNLSNLIILRNRRSTANMLKTFGHMIRKLELLFSFGYNESTTEISQLLNSHCADTLIEIRIETHSQHFFDDMKKPFKKLEIFFMKGSVVDLGSNTLSFNELFPAIKHLKLESLEVTNRNCIDANFKRLEHLDIQRWGMKTNEFKPEDIGNCLKKNPQIRSLVLYNINWPLLELSSKILPHLESLELSFDKNSSSDANEEIIFESVANLTTSTFPEQLLGNIIFKNLTEFHTYNNMDEVTAVIQFVEKTSSLKKLFIRGFTHTNDLRTLTNACLNIEEISLSLMNVAEEYTFNFIRNNQHMRKISFNDKVCNPINVERLTREFSDKWIIISGEETLLLTRRD